MQTPKKVIVLIVGCMSLLLIGASFAYWIGLIGHTNKLTADVMQVKIVEDFVQGADTNGTVEKKVSFKNDSSCAAFLRVSYAETWREIDGENAVLLNNQKEGNDVATKNWTEEWSGKVSLWQDGGDGWFYYKKVLLPESETDPILESVSFPQYTEGYEEYSDASYELYFRAELLQISDSQSTLNSEEVNKKASETVFGKEAIVNGEQVTWK